MIRNLERLRITQDEWIEYLESQVQACKARTSLLQQQYISTLDTLDELVQKHEQELDLESTAKKRLEHRLRKSKEALREVKMERDELQEVVLELIEKVEKSHGDFKLWAPGQLQLSSHTDPIVGTEYPPSSATQLNETQEHLAHANGIIRSLKHDLHLERQTHEETHARVHTLEAQVAHRDAVLETWAQHADYSAPLHTFQNSALIVEPRLAKTLEAQRDLDRNEISTLFLQTLQNNRVLEQEVRRLFNDLEKARLKAVVATPLIQPPFTSSPPPLFAVPDTEAPPPLSPVRGRAIERKLPQQVPSMFHQPTHPLAPHQEVNHTNRTPHPQLLATTTDAAIITRPNARQRRALSSPAPATARTSRHFDKNVGDLHHRAKSYSRTRYNGQLLSVPPEPNPPPSDTLLRHLDDQIRLLSEQIDAFHVERAALLQVINSQLYGGDETATVTSFDSRDVSLEAYNDEGNEGTDGERSMELATPLFPLMTFQSPDQLPTNYVVPATSSSCSRSQSRNCATSSGIIGDIIVTDGVETGRTVLMSQGSLSGQPIINDLQDATEHNVPYTVDVAPESDENQVRMIRPRTSRTASPFLS